MLPKVKDDLLTIESFWKSYSSQEEHRDNGLKRKFISEDRLVVGLVGLPQTGKTTASGILADNLGAISINGNQIRSWLMHMKRDFQNVDTIELYLIEGVLRYKNTNVVVDSDNYAPLKRAFIQAIAVKSRAQVMFIKIEVSKKEWDSRLTVCGSFAHRLYVDLIAKKNDLHNDLKDIPPSLIQDFIKKEYGDKGKLHKVCNSDSEMFQIVSNNGTLESFRAVIYSIVARLQSSVI